MGKEDKFFDLLEASAREAQASVQAVVELTSKHRENPNLEPFIQSRQNDKRIREQISEELLRSSVTSIQREDIETLANTLHKIPKTVQKFAERCETANGPVKATDFSAQVNLLTQATETVLLMIQRLRKKVSLVEFRELNSKLQKLEGEADKVMLELLRDLFSGRHDSLTAVILKDLYELLEKVIDRCRDAGNAVLHIVLKNS